MKKENDENMIRTGRGNVSNSASWYVAYNKEYDKYVARLIFSSAMGCWESFYEIPKSTYEKVGHFRDDDHKSEELIRKGRELYRYANERNYIEPTEITFDKDYQKLCYMLIE